MIKKFFILLTLSLFSNHLYAEDLVKTLSNAFKNNSKLNAERASLNAAKQDVNVSRGEFLPSITLSGDIASQEDTARTNQSGESLADINSTPESGSVLIEQKIFDGFSNYNNLKKSQLKLEYAKFELNKLEQEVILSAARAYYNLGYNFKNLEFNQSNVELFERQAESDRSRLERGEISLTDFAQSESSLAGAQAKLITARNELISGKKNFQKIIGSKSPEQINLTFIPNLMMPSSLETAIASSDQINPRLNLAKIDLEIAKKELFFFPINIILKMLGGVPVDRSSKQNKVDQIADMFLEKDEFRVALSPEGTRQRVEKFKTGFYYIAKKANVPIIMFTLNFKSKEILISNPFYTTNDMKADFNFIESFFDGVEGKVKELSFYRS